MLISLFFALLGFLWLMRRLSAVVSTPIESAVRALNVIVPNVPLISVDKVTDHSMVLHWDPAGSQSQEASKGQYQQQQQQQQQQRSNTVVPTSISHFILYINGLKAATIEGTRQSCSLDGLVPDTNYQVDLVAFNMASFRSRSSPIYVKTAAGERETSALDHPDDLLRALVPGSQKDHQVVVHEAFKVRSRSSTLEGATGATGATGAPIQPPVTASAEPLKTPPHLIADINELKFLLESGLEEVKSLMKSYQDADVEFKEEEARLVLARGEAKERRKIEDRNRASLRQEIRYLEEQRLKADNRIAADKTKLSLRLKRIEKKKDQMEEWHEKVSQMQEYRTSKAAVASDVEGLRKRVENLQKSVFSLQAEVHGIETDIKLELAQRKRLETERQQIASLLSTIERSTDVQSGRVSAEGMTALDNLGKLRPDWEKQIRNEITTDLNNDKKWKSMKQERLKRIDSLKKRLASWESTPSSNTDFNRLLPQDFIYGQDEAFFPQSPSPQNMFVPPASAPQPGPYSVVSSPKLTSLGALAANSANLTASAMGSPMQQTDSVMTGSLLDLQPQSSSPFEDSSALSYATRRFPNNSTPPSRKDSTQISKLFNSLSRGSGGDLSAANTSGNGEYVRNSLEMLSRARSTSLGSSIWSNGTNSATNNNTNWSNSLGISLAAPISLGSTPTSNDGANDAAAAAAAAQTVAQVVASVNATGNPPQTTPSKVSSSYPRRQSSLKMETTDLAMSSEAVAERQNSPSFFKSKIFKFGTSPTKGSNKNNDRGGSSGNGNTNTNNTNNNNNNGSSSYNGNSYGDGVIAESAGESTNSSPVHHNSSNRFGARSSRFFKLSSRKASSHSQASASTTSTGDNEEAESASEGSASRFGTGSDAGATGNSQGSGHSGQGSASGGDQSTGNGGQASSSGSGSGSGSSSGSILSRRLTFAFKRDKKEMTIEEEETEEVAVEESSESQSKHSSSRRHS